VSARRGTRQEPDDERNSKCDDRQHGAHDIDDGARRRRDCLGYGDGVGDCSDNTGVVGVQFLLDGVALGTEVTTDPTPSRGTARGEQRVSYVVCAGAGRGRQPDDERNISVTIDKTRRPRCR